MLEIAPPAVIRIGHFVEAVKTDVLKEQRCLARIGAWPMPAERLHVDAIHRQNEIVVVEIGRANLARAMLRQRIPVPSAISTARGSAPSPT